MAKIQTVGILPQNCNDWLSPSWKAPVTTLPAGAIDCKTVYKVGDLVIKHL